MKEKILSNLTFLIIVCISLFFVEHAFAQCGTNFKTGYRKILSPNNSYSVYNLEDWNNDGKSDFWTLRLNPNTLKRDLFVFLNNGNWDWNWDNPVVYATTIPEFTGSEDIISVIDFEGDGDKDIFYVQARTFHTLHRNNGNGTFTASATQLFDDAQVMSSTGFFDVNNDNRLDWIQLANISGTGNPIIYRPANADGTYGAAVIISNTSTQGSGRLLGDFNGDGKTDIVYTQIGSYYVLTNNGVGNFTLAGPHTFVAPGTGFGSVRDFNSDGKDDILAQVSPDTNTPRKVYVYYGQANGTFSALEYPVNAPDAYANTLVGEFNGDNKPDFIEDRNNSSNFGPPFHSVFINDGAGGFTRTDHPKSLGVDVGGSVYVLADLNGDNKTDIFLPIRHSRYIGNIFGERVIIIRYNQCQSFGEVKKANYDGNSKEDLAAWNPNTGDWRSTDAMGNSSPAFKIFNWGLGSLGDVPAPGDFDGDGKSDYSVYRNGEGKWYIYLSASSSWYVFKFGLPGDIPVPNDYDGGGKSDVAVFRPSDGNWHIWLTETQQYSVIHFGANGDKPVAQDYDGDGKTDVAVYRPSEGNWYYLKSSDQNYAVFHWGIATDKPVPADYDGDGKADLAVFRQSDGTWYILRSYNNAQGYFYLATGSDVPVPIYENGEMANPTVYSNSNHKWYGFLAPEMFWGNTQLTPVYFGLPNN